MSEWLGLNGKRVAIAGGGGTLGGALVDGFLEYGSSVGVLDVNTDRVDPRVAVRAGADLSDSTAARAALADVRAKLGGLDVFIHCVGINERKPLEEFSAEEWGRIISVNLTSAFHTATEAAAGMRDQRFGRIVLFVGGGPQRAQASRPLRRE